VIVRSAGTATAQVTIFSRRDAASRREKIDTGAVAVPADLTITGLMQVGSTGVNVHFSDGHDRAIYPFAYLRELSDRFGN